PHRCMVHHGVSVDYLGQVDAPFSSRCIRANRFHIALRDLTAAQAITTLSSAKAVRADGVPNYFDDQRFGSVAGGGEFVAKLMVLGRFEEALRIALTAPYEFDRVDEKRVKATLE